MFEPGKSWSLAPLDRWGVFGLNRKRLQFWFTWFTCWFTWFVFVDSDWILIFCFSIVFCPDGTMGPCSAGFWARGHIKVRLSSLTLPWRRWRSRHHLTPVLRTREGQSLTEFCPGVVPNIQGSSRFFMVENCSFRLGLDLLTHQYCGSCATALAIYINLCYPKLRGPGYRSWQVSTMLQSAMDLFEKSSAF